MEQKQPGLAAAALAEGAVAKHEFDRLDSVPEPHHLVDQAALAQRSNDELRIGVAVFDEQDFYRFKIIHSGLLWAVRMRTPRRDPLCLRPTLARRAGSPRGGRWQVPRRCR